jgi:hypothetical protein
LAARAVFDVQGLGVNVTGYCPIKARVAFQVHGGGLQEKGIDIMAVTRVVVVVVGNVDRSLRRKNGTQNSNTKNGK